MGRWQNFSIWRGRLPHWRADDVRYYVTFRHRRELTDPEMHLLYARLMRAQRRRLDFLILSVRPTASEMVFLVQKDPEGEPYELSDVVEKAKRQAGAAIIKRSGERFPPFYLESYDRILRDDDEFEATFLRILQAPADEGWIEEEADWVWQFVPEAP